jgi:putative Holliday junction resolvase
MKILSIDYGRRRIGLAVSDETETLASGLDVLDRKKEKNIILKIKDCCLENSVETVIIGYPYRQNGEKGELCGEIDSFVREIEQCTSLGVITVDEAYSTLTAHELLFARGKKRKKHKQVVDRVAACQILQNYLDEKKK